MKTITVETSQLSGHALDWVVAIIDSASEDFAAYSPSTNWRQGGPLIGRISSLTQDDAGNWYAIPKTEYEVIELSGQTPLIAICRAIVAAELGDDVEVPAELVEASNA